MKFTLVKMNGPTDRKYERDTAWGVICDGDLIRLMFVHPDAGVIAARQIEDALNKNQDVPASWCCDGKIAKKKTAEQRRSARSRTRR